MTLMMWRKRSANGIGVRPTTNFKWSARFALVMLALQAIACQKSDESGRTSPGIVESSDAAWASTLSYSAHPLLDMDTGAADIRAYAENAKQQFRDDGIVFWHRYPDDRRRYDFLIMTVHLAPTYGLGGADSGAQFDSERQCQWEQQYRSMRAEFLTSEHTTEYDRRYLWYGDLTNEIKAHTGMMAYCVKPQASKILSGIGDYLAGNSEPLDEADRDSFEWEIVSLVQSAVRGLAQSSLSIEERSTFKELVDRTVVNFVRWSIEPEIWNEFLRIESQQDSTKSPNRWRDALKLAPPYQVHTTPGLAVLRHDRELTARLNWAEGLRLWDADPNHESRYRWLINMQVTQPEFVHDLILDSYTASTERAPSSLRDDCARRYEVWLGHFRALMNEFLESEYTSRSQRRALEIINLRATLERLLRCPDQPKEKIEFLQGMTRIGKSNLDEFPVEYRFLYRITVRSSIMNALRLQLNENDLTSMLNPLRLNENSELRNIAEGWFRQESLRANPVVFSANTLSGDTFSTDKLRGKIVLMDFWSTSCSSCIAAMPLIHEIYTEYRDRGFEVVSVNFDADQNRRRVERIGRELSLTWTTLNAESQWEEANARFGWGNMLPVYMLLDRDGKLIAGTEEIDHGRNLRALLDEMLAAEAAEKDAATVH